MSTIIRVETQIIKSSNELDMLCFCSKNFYNKANYEIRKKFIETSKLKKEGLIDKIIYLNYYDIEKIMKNIEEFNILSAQTRQSILRVLDKNWKSFFISIKDWSKNKSKYKGKPKPPKYLDKQGRNILIFPGQNLKIKDKICKIPKTTLQIKTQITKNQLKELRIKPLGNKNFKIELIYEKEIQNLNLNKKKVIGIDIGLNNLMAITSNQPESLCCLINGRPLKNINQFYNKTLSYSKSTLKKVNNKNWSFFLSNLSLKRKLKIDDYLHKTSKVLMNLCKEYDIGKIVIGKNKCWKSEINLSKRNNQNFVQIPFSRLIQMIQYKAEELGVEVILTEESYTSKIDHLALESLEHHKSYLGKRIKRGLFKSSTNVLLNADINGALGILRKINAISDEFLKTLGNRGCVLQPIKLNC